MLKKNILISILIISTILGMTACGNPSDRGPRANQSPSAYDNDGMLGITNANPNLRTSPTHYNYNRDIQLAEQTVRKTAPVRKSRVIINGGNMYVHVQVPAHEASQVELIKTNTLQALTHQLPRYNIHLTISAEG